MTAIRLTLRRPSQSRHRLPRLRRSWRALAFVAASGIAIAGVAGAGSAGAGNPPAPPTYTFSSDATAIDVQATLQRNPDFSSLPDPADAEVPDSESHLDSFGTSTADAHVANLNGLGGAAGLVCLAAGAATCAEIPIGTITAGLIPTFPPPDPLDASSTYPANQTAKAPIIGTHQAQLSVAESGFALAGAASSSTAHQFDTSTSAALQNLGLAGAVSVGHATTSTTQTATATALTTTAVATLSDISIGGTLLHIGTMKSMTTVVSKPGKPSTDTTSTTLADVKALGLAATVDSSGIHISGKGLPVDVLNTVQKLVNKVLGAAGVKLALASITRSNDDSGHHVAAYGLRLTFDRNVKGTTPITIAPPTGIPCPPILAGFPVNPCSGVSFSLDGAYHGQIALGQVGVVSFAAPGGSTPVLSPPGSTTGPGSGTTGPGGGAVGPVVVPPTGPGVTSSPPSVAPPVVATPGQQQVADQLGDVSHRLKWFFPLLAVGLLALIGRLRTPSRLPGTGS